MLTLNLAKIEYDLSDKNLNILVVDDDQSISMLLSEILNLWQHKVTVKHSAKDALVVIEDEDYDIIFTDMLMPEMNGMELIQKAVFIKPEIKSRVVFTTGMSGESFGAEYHDFIILEKPFKIKDVQTAISDIVD